MSKAASGTADHLRARETLAGQPAAKTRSRSAAGKSIIAGHAPVNRWRLGVSTVRKEPERPTVNQIRAMPKRGSHSFQAAYANPSRPSTAQKGDSTVPPCAEI